MARVKNKLTVKFVEGKRKAGYYSDGGGLYLRVTKTLNKSWAFYYKKPDGKRTELSLGNIETVSLEQARNKAHELRLQLAAGIDPIAQRKALVLANQLALSKQITFAECAAAYIDKKLPEFKNPKHGQQWRNTIEQYATPIIGALPITEIDTPQIIKCLEPIWLEKNETASRLRGRIEQVLDWAKVSGFRDGENPARWRGHLDKLLPKPSKVQKVEHHPALNYRQVPEFMQQLQHEKGNAARCLELAILTAVRAENALGATWDEFNLDEKLWIIPSQRMKVQQGGRVARDHIVPLTDACLSLLKQMQNSRVNDWVFSGTSKVKRKGGLSENAMAIVLKRMGKADITAHGFRSTFSDYITEMTNHSPEAREICLAHVVKNAAEAAYRRGDMLDKRRALMQDWTDYLYSKNL